MEKVDNKMNITFLPCIYILDVASELFLRVYLISIIIDVTIVLQNTSRPIYRKLYSTTTK